MPPGHAYGKEINPLISHKLKKPNKIYIQLGRTGDAIASVPLCYLHYKETGVKCALMVARQFAGFLEGISYIIPEIWEGDFRDIPGAIKSAKNKGYQDIVSAQIYGWGANPKRETTSFILESWNQVGKLEHWDKVPLIFDRRNSNREYILSVGLPKGKPIVLVAMSGHSAPFPYPDKLLKVITNHVGSRAAVVDLAAFKAQRFHDFLGLFDKAACLVTCDTAFGQLAMASKIPVCALVAFKPSTWHSSPKRSQHICYIRYNDFNSRTNELLTAIDSTLGVNLKTESTIIPKPTINHIWTDALVMSDDKKRRIGVAKQTWENEANSYGFWKEHFIDQSNLERSAKDIGEDIPLPFLHDMLDSVKDAKDEDILLITNADICLVDGVSEDILDNCSRFGATYCHRWDFPIIKTLPSKDYIETKGQFYIGADAFAVTVKWWRENKEKLPPFIIGRECWDWAFRVLIDETGGQKITVGIYHEKHESPWEINRGLAGNIWNRSYCKEFLLDHDIDPKPIGSTQYIRVNWPPIK